MDFEIATGMLLANNCPIFGHNNVHTSSHQQLRTSMNYSLLQQRRQGHDDITIFPWLRWLVRFGRIRASSSVMRDSFKITRRQNCCRAAPFNNGRANFGANKCSYMRDDHVYVQDTGGNNSRG